MALPNARNQYLKTQIETASKEQLVVMLFDGIVRFTDQARRSIEGGNVEDSHHALMRAQAIIMELICTIDKDKGGDVANNLMSLHAYAFNCLIVCNMKKDVSKIDEVQKIYRDLREAWVGAMGTLGIASIAGRPAPTDSTPPTPAGTFPKALPTAISGKPAAGGPGFGVMASVASKPVASLNPLNATAGSVLSPGMAKSVNAANVSDGIATAPTISKTTGYGMGQNVNIIGVASGPSVPQTGSYGVGRSALMGSLMGKSAAPQSTPAGTIAPVSVKKNALLNAYAGGRRSIA